MGRLCQAAVRWTGAVLQYLARYTHRVAISNHRLLSVDDKEVRFRWKDYAHQNKRRVMTLPNEEFLRRFLQHVLPRGFPRIRYFGWLANRKRGPMLELCRELLRCLPLPQPAARADTPAVCRCPQCNGPMQIIERLNAVQLLRLRFSLVRGLDSS